MEGMPLPFRRKVVPDWVPSGRVYFTLPSMVGISSSAPSTAWVKVMGASHRDGGAPPAGTAREAGR